MDCNFLYQSTEANINGFRHGCNVFNQLTPIDACIETNEAMRERLSMACEKQANELENIIWYEFAGIGLLLLLVVLLIYKK